MATKKIKQKRISVNMIDEIMNGFGNTETVTWNNMDVVIKKTLSLEEMLKFADSVAKSCFDQTSGAYMPEIKDFAIRSNILDMYANFTLPKDLNRQYDFVVRSGAVEMVMNHVNKAQFDELMDAIDMKIKNTADAHIQAFITKMDEMTAAFAGVQEKMAEMFSGIDAEDVARLFEAVSGEGNLEKNVVQSYMDMSKKAE